MQKVPVVLIQESKINSRAEEVVKDIGVVSLLNGWPSSYVAPLEVSSFCGILARLPLWFNGWMNFLFRLFLRIWKFTRIVSFLLSMVQMLTREEQISGGVGRS